MNTNDYINLYGIFRQLNSDILSKYNEDESSLKCVPECVPWGRPAALPP